MHGIERAFVRWTMHVLLLWVGGLAVASEDIKSTGYDMGAVHGFVCRVAGGAV